MRIWLTFSEIEVWKLINIKMSERDTDRETEKYGKSDRGKEKEKQTDLQLETAIHVGRKQERKSIL